MIFPKKDSIYENLNSSFTNFSELLVDLKDNSFTGVVKLSYWEYEGNLLLDNGNIVNALENISGKIITGQEAVKRVTKKAEEKDGSISVYSLAAEMITLLASVVKSEIIYENLSTEFTSLEALVSKLRSEDHTGYIEIKYQINQETGYLFLLSGTVIEALLSTRGEEISGKTVLSRIIELASSAGATYSVYKAALDEALSESEMIKVSYDLPQLLEVWSAVISAVESAVDSQLGKNTFLGIFKDALIAQADEYPFLDPFAAKFQYVNGNATFSGEVKKDFNKGLGAGLWGTVEALAERAALEGKDLFGPLRVAMDPVKQEYQGKLDRFNFSAIMPDLFS